MLIGANAQHPWRRASIVAALLMLAPAALALSPDLSLRQLHRTAWTASEGAPTGVESMAQTTDGYLWIAAAAGLFRFDGVRFERVDAVRGQRLLSTSILSLHATPNGGLWIGYRFGGASLIREGKLWNYGTDSGLAIASITHFAEDHLGTVWANTAGDLMRLQGTKWEDASDTFKIPHYVKCLGLSRDGALWIVNGNDVMVLRPGQSVFEATGIRTGDDWSNFVEAPDGRFWVADSERGIHALYTPGAAVAQRWIPLRDARGEPLRGMLVDRHETLWMASSTGIHRMKNVARLQAPRSAPGSSGDAFANVDSLAAPYSYSFLEDREGNVWVGTAGGVNRLRESRLTPVYLPREADGFAVAAADAGAMLVGIGEGGAFRVTADSSTDLQPGPRYIDAAYRGDDGVVWLGGRAMLWHSGGSPSRRTWVPISVPVDSAHPDYYPVQAIARDKAGTLWVSLVRAGVMRYAEGRWTKFNPTPALSLASGEDGRIWAGYVGNKVQVIDPEANVARELSANDGLEMGNVMSILARKQDAWVGGDLGLARFDGQRFHGVTHRGGGHLPSVSGIVATPQGDLWLNTTAGAMKIAADEVARVSANPRHAIQYALFDFLDGMPGTPNSIRPLPSLAAGTDGRLWFATTSGIVWIDPQRIRHNGLAPNVEVQSIVADAKRYEPGPGLELPIGTRNLQIAYTALSLSIPERVRFRYRLGDREPWQDAGSRRVAYYTDLDPGEYKFRVIASNHDGVWNEAGASIAFTIPPAFNQTKWFYALLALAGVAVLTALYRVRMLQVAAHVRGRLEARLAERERIARDLHDTLLQGMQGLIWRFQAATDRIPSGEPARDLMEESLDRADKLLAESRDKVKELRPAQSDAGELAQALAAEGEHFAQLHPVQFRVSVHGTRRDLHPIVREEGFLIAREGLSNAFQHAQAQNIETEVTYGDAALHVRIRDDGRGIGATVLDAGGRPGHFGLVGMRERAKKLGAHLEVWSKPGAGTEIDLQVPAQVAYGRSQATARGPRAWLARFRSAAAEH